MGASAVAGCSSTRQDEPSDEPGVDESGRDECVDRSQYEELQTRYEDLRERYGELRNNPDLLEARALPIPYIENKRRKSIATFETIDGEILSWEWDSSIVENQSANGSAIRRMTYSELEYLGWDKYGFEGGSKYRQLDDFGEFYQLNPFVIPSNFDGLADKFYDRNDSDLARIREAWNFIMELNDYVADVEETPRFPLETLLFGGGDCEDSCILLGSILYSMPGSITPYFWHMDIDNPREPREINHVIIGAKTDEKEYLINTTSETMLPYDEVVGFSTKVSPTW